MASSTSNPGQQHFTAAVANVSATGISSGGGGGGDLTPSKQSLNLSRLNSMNQQSLLKQFNSPALSAIEQTPSQQQHLLNAAGNNF